MPITFASTVKLESKAVPGVTVHLRPVLAARKLELDSQLADAIKEHDAFAESYRLANERLNALSADDAPGREAEATAAIRALSGIIDLSERQIKPAYLTHMVKRIDGALTDEGKPVDVPYLLENGPQALIDEIYLFLRQEWGLAPKEQGESESPTTSGVAVDGTTNATTATTAAPIASTSDATA